MKCDKCQRPRAYHDDGECPPHRPSHDPHSLHQAWHLCWLSVSGSLHAHGWRNPDVAAERVLFIADEIGILIRETCLILIRGAWRWLWK